MQENEVTLTMKVKSNDPFEFKAKKQMLEILAKLDSNKLTSLVEMSKVDNTTLENLASLTGSQKAINTFNSKIGFIKTLMG